MTARVTVGCSCQLMVKCPVLSLSTLPRFHVDEHCRLHVRLPPSRQRLEHLATYIVTDTSIHNSESTCLSIRERLVALRVNREDLSYGASPESGVRHAGFSSPSPRRYE